jgi:protease PrsW
VSAQPTSATVGTAVRTVSPVAVTMVLISAWGAWQLWQQNAAIALELGLPAFLGFAVWAVYGAITVAIVVALQRFAHRPLWGVALALAWGAFAATWAGTEANGAFSTIFLRTAGSDPNAWLSTPVIEESLKALGVLGLLLIPVLRRFRTLDGLFYGVIVGAGLQVMEDAIYTLTTLFHDPSDPLGAIFGNLFVRGLTIGLFTHAVYTGIVGAAIGWAASAPTGYRVRRSVGAVVVLVAMMFAHGLFNSQDETTLLTVGMGLVPLVVLLIVIWWARREEVRHLADEARSNDGWGVLSTEQIASVNAPRPKERDARRDQSRVRRFAWAADRLGLEAKGTERAREDLAGTTP